MLFILLAACSLQSEPVAEAPTPVVGEFRSVSAGAELRTALAPIAKDRLINVWATWCEPCVFELPMIQQFHVKHPEIEIVFVNADGPRTPIAGTRHFLKERQLGFARQVHIAGQDPSAALADGLDGWTDVLPYSVLMSAKGETIKNWTGVIDFEELEGLLTPKK